MDSSKGSSKEGGEFSDSGELHDSKCENPKLSALHEYHLAFALEANSDVQHPQIFSKRRDIVSGDIEPADEDCDWPTDDDDLCLDNLSEKLKSTANVTKDINNSNKDSLSEVKGVPDFWLKTLENISLFEEMVQDHDRDILKHLTDLKCVLNTGEESDEDTEMLLESDFKLGQFLRESVIPKAVLYFTGEAVDSEFDDDDEDDDDDDDLDDEDLSDEDEDDKDEEHEKENSHLHSCRGRHHRAPNRPKSNQNTGEKQECPQQ
ncbi:unnamed protein product [Schistosoma turkestanicum]|nr:unnamed protein product [Schistosoma turkestanicum]